MLKLSLISITKSIIPNTQRGVLGQTQKCAQNISLQFFFAFRFEFYSVVYKAFA